MTDQHPRDLPSAFVAAWIARLAPGIAPGQRALDVAMGRGRHALMLARAGWRTFGVDVALKPMREALEAAAREHLAVRVWCTDLTRCVLPPGAFDLMVVTRYLQRDLFGTLARALVPGGVLLYETFTEAQRSHGWGPTSPHHLLRPGELRALAAELETMAYEEIVAPEAVARLAARRRRNPS